MSEDTAGLGRVIAAWPLLPAYVRLAIIAVSKAATPAPVDSNKRLDSKPQQERPTQAGAAQPVLLDDGLVNLRAAAKLLALSVPKVYQLMETGQLSYIKIGRSRRVRKTDLLELVQEHEVGRH